MTKEKKIHYEILLASTMNTNVEKHEITFCIVD